MTILLQKFTGYDGSLSSKDPYAKYYADAVTIYDVIGKWVDQKPSKAREKRLREEMERYHQKWPKIQNFSELKRDLARMGEDERNEGEARNIKERKPNAEGFSFRNFGMKLILLKILIQSSRQHGTWSNKTWYFEPNC